MAHFIKADPFLARDLIAGKYHGKLAWRNDNPFHPYGRYEESDKLGRLTGVYYHFDGEDPRPRSMVVHYRGRSRRPYALWFCSNGSIDMHFCFKYRRNGCIDTVYFWANGGNTCNEFHYRMGKRTETVKQGKRTVSRETFPTVIINGHESPFLGTIPRMDDVSWFYAQHCHDHVGPRSRCENDWALRYWLGITDVILHDRYPKRPKSERNPRVDGMHVREGLAMQGMINTSRL